MFDQYWLQLPIFYVIVTPDIDRDTGQLVIFALEGVVWMMEMKNMLTRIASATDRELTDIVRAVLARYDTLFPEEEVFFLSLPKHSRKEREAILTQFKELVLREH